MDIRRTGVILNVENFEQCVAFYRRAFDLPVLFEQTDGDFRLCCLAFGGAYLMIETEGTAKPQGKTIAENATKLRFNVADMEAARERLLNLRIDAEIKTNDWGSTINVFDPDGNRVGIRDEAGFVGQLG